MPSERFDVVVSGASFAGLLLALALRKSAGSALSLAVIDPAGASMSKPDFRAFALSAGSVRLLRALDLWPAIEPLAQPVTRIDITDSPLDSHERQVLLRYDNHTEEGDPASHIVESTVLSRAIAEAVQASGPDHIEVDGVEAIVTKPGSVEIACAKGARLETRLAVAADGRKSPLRELAGIKTVGWKYPQSAIVTMVRHDRPHEGVATQHFLPGGPFAILPLAGGHRSSLTWSEGSVEAARILALDDAGFLAEVKRRFGEVLGEVSLDGPRVAYPLEMHLSRSLIADRVALMGDAARGVHPIAGQGLNLGLRDVAALAEIIVQTHRLGLDIGSVQPLERYQRWRRFDSVMSAAAMDGLNKLFSTDNAMLRTLRDAGLGLTDRIPWLKRMLVGEAAGLTGELPMLLTGLLP